MSSLACDLKKVGGDNYRFELRGAGHSERLVEMRRMKP
jgi:hypothetical protein